MPTVSGVTSAIPDPALQQTEADIQRLRSLTIQERDRLIVSACRLASEIARGRAASGLPPVTPAPWPPSTWELLKKFARHGRSR